MEKEDTTENKLLEMSNHFKEVLDEKEKIVDAMKEKYITNKKKIARVYGLIVELQEYIDEVPVSLFDDNDMVVEFLINSIRAITSSVLFNNDTFTLS